MPVSKLNRLVASSPNSGWQVSSLPPEEKQDSNAVGYALKAEGDKETLHLTRKLHIDLLLLDPQYYSSLRGFFQVVRKGDEQQVVLFPGGTNASN